MNTPRQIRKFGQFAAAVARGFLGGHGHIMAAAISCYVYFSAVPILLLLVAGWGYVLGSTESAQEMALSYVKDFSPALVEQQALGIRNIVEQLIQGRLPATWVGVVTLLWTGSNVVMCVEHAINHSWEEAGQRNYLARRGLAFGVLPVLALLFGFSIACTGWVGTVKTLDDAVMGLRPSQWPWFWILITYIVPAVVTVAAFTFLYAVLPRKRLPFRASLVGGLVAGVAWESSKLGFSWYIRHYVIHTVYGPLTGIFLLMMWINLSAALTIIGSEATYSTAKWGELTS